MPVNFWTILGMMVWLLAVCVIGGVAVDRWFDGRRLSGAVYGAAAVLLSAGGISLLVGEYGTGDSRLCLSGHQEWVRVNYPAAIVGKMIMPARTGSEKRWICDQWESR